MLRRLLLAVLLAALPLVGAAAPAVAQEIRTVDIADPVEPGQRLEQRCPANYQVQRTATGDPNAAMSFYRKEHHREAFVTNVAPTGVLTETSGMWIGVFWTVPKGAHYAVGTLVCTTIIQQIVVIGQQTEAGVVNEVNCPAVTPWVSRIIWVIGDADSLDTPGGQYLLAYEPTATGVRFTTEVGHYWQVVLECSAFPRSSA